MMFLQIKRGKKNLLLIIIVSNKKPCFNFFFGYVKCLINFNVNLKTCLKKHFFSKLYKIACFSIIQLVCFSSK